MLIRDLEAKAGLDRATIRFYEKEGFISPQRKENGYREYTPDDLDHLLKIKLMRQLGMPLNTIRELQQGNKDFESALSECISYLDRQIQNASKAKDICTELYNSKANYKTLDAEYYLDQFNRQAEKETPTAFSERLERPYHPVRRWFARLTDYALVALLLEIVFVMIIRIRPISDLLANCISWTNVFISVPISALLLHRFGATPGKWLYGLSVRSENGDKLSFHNSLRREWNVLKSGFGFHIPLWSTWRLWNSYRDYKEGEIEWEQQSEYQYDEWKPTRKLLLGLCIIAIITANLFVISDMFSPKHLGDLTVEEFAANYNYYGELLTGKNESFDKMAADGTWGPDTMGHVTVYATAQPIYPKQTFVYKTENDIINSICYSNKWTDIIWYSPLQNECERAAITAVMSQKGTGLGDLMQFTKILNDTQFDSNGTITYKNIEFSWEIETSNCQFVNGRFFTRIDDTQESSVSVNFNIVIQ